MKKIFIFIVLFVTLNFKIFSNIDNYVDINEIKYNKYGVSLREKDKIYIGKSIYENGNLILISIMYTELISEAEANHFMKYNAEDVEFFEEVIHNEKNILIIKSLEDDGFRYRIVYVPNLYKNLGITILYSETGIEKPLHRNELTDNELKKIIKKSYDLLK